MVLFCNGCAKFALLKMLKISHRNWTLKLSEIFGTWAFLTSEKSKFESPGPISVFRPRFPLRVGGLGKVKHCSFM